MDGSIQRYTVLATVLASVALAQSAKPPVWIGPPGVDNGKALRALFEHPDEWRQTRAMVDGILYTTNNLRPFSDDELRQWFGRLREWKLKLMLEVGAIKEWGVTGDDTYRKQLAAWEHIEKLGGTIESMALDEPLLCTRKRLNKPDDYAVEQTARFIQLVRERFPQLRVGDIETYPSIPAADHRQWIENLNAKLRSLHVRELDFYRLDVNWINFTVQQWGGWKEVRELEQFCRARHLPFSLIYWPADLPFLKRIGRAGESTWYLSLMHEAQAYAEAGGAPDEFVVESWVGEPARAVPETAEWTFTRSVRDLVEWFVKPPAPVETKVPK